MMYGGSIDSLRTIHELWFIAEIYSCSGPDKNEKPR
jgi:hypothetical protein